MHLLHGPFRRTCLRSDVQMLSLNDSLGHITYFTGKTINIIVVNIVVVVVTIVVAASPIFGRDPTHKMESTENHEDQFIKVEDNPTKFRGLSVAQWPTHSLLTFLLILYVESMDVPEGPYGAYAYAPGVRLRMASE